MNSQKLAKRKDANLASEWFSSSKTKEEKEEFEQYLRNSSRLFDHLKGMIQKRYDACLGANEEDYDAPSWSHKQAHRNGKLEALEELYKLLP